MGGRGRRELGGRGAQGCARSAPTGLVLAGADTPDDTDTVVRKVQEYVKQATDVVKSVFTTVQESEAAQQARCLRTPKPAGHPAPCPLPTGAHPVPCSDPGAVL